MRNGTSWEKKEKACIDEEKEDHGDQWDHVVIDAKSKAVISMVFCFGYRVARSGKRTKEKTEELIQDLASRCNDSEPPELFTTVEQQNGTDRHLNPILCPPPHFLRFLVLLIRCEFSERMLAPALFAASRGIHWWILFSEGLV